MLLMDALNRMACIALALVVSTAAGDAARSQARIGSPRAAAAGPASTLPPFVLFGWVSPPADSLTPARIAEMAGCGLDLTLPGWQDRGLEADNRERLDWGHAEGLGALVWDARTEEVDFDTLEGQAPLDSIVADYAVHPGLVAYYFGDEPQAGEFGIYGHFRRALAARDTVHPIFNDLLGRGYFGSAAEWEDYARAYVESTQAAVLCDNHYDFVRSGDRGLFMENAIGLRKLSREYGIPFWCIVQLVEHGSFRALAAGELRWQVSMLLAYGARGIGYFTYWTPDYDPYWQFQTAVIGRDGVRGPSWDVLAAFNPWVRAAGRTLASQVWLSTEHAHWTPRGATAFAPDDGVKAVEGRAALGSFAGERGERYLLVANSDSSMARTIALTLGPGVVSVGRLGAAEGHWTPLVPTPVAGGARVELALEAGMFALLRLQGPATGVDEAGVAPRLSLAPNPARGEVRLSAAARAGGRLEILDAGSRRVWGRDLAPGAAELVWRGERDDGGRVPAGVYFARFEDPQGVTSARIVWLGER
jgi:hypothetical protein